jgi:hypothetical protein
MVVAVDGAKVRQSRLRRPQPSAHHATNVAEQLKPAEILSEVDGAEQPRK